MTDRHSGYIVVLSKDTREDDAEAIINAIRMLKGVVGVTPVVADAATAIASMRTRREVVKRLYTLIESLDKEPS